MSWNLEELLAEHNTPFYVVKPEIAVSRYKTLQQNLNWVVKYASKANFDPQIVSSLNDAGASFVCGSPKEALLCQQAGVTPERLQVTAVAPSQDGINTLVSLSNQDPRFITTVNSLSTVKQLKDAGYSGRVLLRIAAEISDQDDSKYTNGSHLKFGMGADEREQAIEIITDSEMRFHGIHSHLGGSFYNGSIEVFTRHIRRTLQIALDYQDQITVVNFGGGLGYGYKPMQDNLYLQRFVDEIAPILEPYESRFEFVFEPGRYIVAPASVLVTEVRTVRERNGEHFVGVDAGMAEFPRPTMFDVYHHISLFLTAEDDMNRTVVEQTVAGPTCSGADIFGTDRPIPKAEVGDVMLIHDVGAYGVVMSNHFHGYDSPLVLSTDGTKSPSLCEYIDI